MKVKTKENILFEAPLDKQINLRLTFEEYGIIESTAKSNTLSNAELIRNLVRENIYKYVSSLDVRKTLKIKAKIDTILLNRRLISRNLESNLSKTREILTDFEDFMLTHPKRIDYDALRFRFLELQELCKLIYQEDKYLSGQIDTQYKRVLKNKLLKGLDLFPVTVRDI